MNDEANLPIRYLVVQDKIEKQISTLKDKLHVHKYLFEYNGSNDYGYVGDLNRVLEKIKEINDILRMTRYDFKDEYPKE